MRRDVCYYFAADVVSVYNAYLAAATNQKFRRIVTQEPYHTISFGLNMSFKFNMNGGACTLHFIPYQGGTAVDLRFSLAQVMGARYGAYAQELTNDASAVLGVIGQKFELDINLFLNDANKVVPAAVSAAPTQAAAAPQPQKACSNCGNALGADAAFCPSCGTKADADKRYCPQCGNPCSPDGKFCAKCGNKLG